MNIIEQIIGFAVAGFLLFFAYKLLEKDKLGQSSLIALLAIALVFYSFSATQGLLKGWFMSKVNAQLAALGEQVTSVEGASSNMQAELDQHQKQIAQHQKELDGHQINIRTAQTNIADQQGNITNQFHEIASVQGQLARTQTNLDEQEKKLEDVSYLVSNLYSKMTVEHFDGTDTNRVTFLSFADGTIQVFWKLSHAPILGSIQVITSKTNGEQFPLVGVVNELNIAAVFFGKTSAESLKADSFTIQYVIDSRQTNLLHKVEFEGTKIYLDGMPYQSTHNPPRT